MHAYNTSKLYIHTKVNIATKAPILFTGRAFSYRLSFLDPFLFLSFHFYKFPDFLFFSGY